MSDPNPLAAIPRRGFIASPWHTLSIPLFFYYMVVSAGGLAAKPEG
jgi:hypothetical protein